jgi:hypothetical protein
MCVALKCESYQFYPSTVLETGLESNRDDFVRLVLLNMNGNTVMKINIRQVLQKNC